VKGQSHARKATVVPVIQSASVPEVYGRLYSNDGAMTPGVDGETVDGMSLARIGHSSTRCAMRVDSRMGMLAVEADCVRGSGDRPGGRILARQGYPVTNVIRHSDTGIQYTSVRFPTR